MSEAVPPANDARANNGLEAAAIEVNEGLIRVAGDDYVWEWRSNSDQFRLLDRSGLVIVEGQLQPAVVVQKASHNGVHCCSSGEVARHEVAGNAVSIVYEGVNDQARLRLAWKFERQGFWLDPVLYETSEDEDVLSLHYFSAGNGQGSRPTLASDYFLLPGIMQSSVMNPVVPVATYWNMRIEDVYWVGRGYLESPRFLQQLGVAGPLLLRLSSLSLRFPAHTKCAGGACWI